LKCFIGFCFQKGHIALMANGPYFESMGSLINFYKSNNIPKHNSPLTKAYSLVRKAWAYKKSFWHR